MQLKTTPTGSVVWKNRSSFSETSVFKRLVLLLALLLMYFGVSAQVPIAYFSFEDGTNRNSTSETSPEVYVSEVSASSMVRVGTGSLNPTSGTGVAFSGWVSGATAGLTLSSNKWLTTQNDPGINQTPPATVTSYYQFYLNTTGLVDRAIDLYKKKSAKGPKHQGMPVSFDNVKYSIIGFTTGLKKISVFRKKGLQTQVFPNPFQQQFSLSVPSEKKQEASLIVSDALGPMVPAQKQTLTAGENQIQANLPEAVTPGIYTVALTTFAGASFHKIIKNKP